MSEWVARSQGRKGRRRRRRRTSFLTRVLSYASNRARVFSSALTRIAFSTPPCFAANEVPFTTSKQRKTASGSPYSTKAKVGEGRLSVITGPAVCSIHHVVKKRKRKRQVGFGSVQGRSFDERRGEERRHDSTTYAQYPLQPAVLQPFDQVAHEQRKLFARPV